MKKVVLQLWIGLEVEDAIAEDIEKVRELITFDVKPCLPWDVQLTELAHALDQSDQPVGEPWVWF